MADVIVANKVDEPVPVVLAEEIAIDYIPDLSSLYVPYDGALFDVDIGENAFKQTRASSDPNFFGLSYMKGLKLTSATVDDDENADGGYFTFTPTSTVGTMRFETKGGAYSSNSVELRFDITDEAIHVDNPIIIDTSATGGVLPDIRITNGTDTMSFTGATFTTSDSSVETVITPTAISGSPTILMDKSEQDTNIIEAYDSATLTVLDGTAGGDLFDEGSTLYGSGTSWTTDLIVGKKIWLNGAGYTNQVALVVSITSDTEITVNATIPLAAEGITITTYTSEVFVLNSGGQIESNLRPEFDSAYSLGSTSLRWLNTWTDKINNNLVTNFETAYTHSQLTTGNPHNLTLTDLDSYAHNDTSDLQGGTTGEYYHLTSTEAGYIDQDVTSGATPTFGDIKGETKCWDVTITKPGDFYAIDTQIPVGYTKSAITVTKIVVSTNTASYEVLGDLKWADNLTAFTNATVINDFDTTSGVRTDDTITAGSVAAGKYLYLQLDSAPNAAVTWFTIHIEWHYD